MSYQCERCNRKESGSITQSYMGLGLCTKCDSLIKKYVRGDMFSEKVSQRIREIVNTYEYESEVDLIRHAVTKFLRE